MTAAHTDITIWLGAQFDADDAEIINHRVHGTAPAELLDQMARDIEAKRRILDEAANYSPELEHGDNGEWALGMVLRLLALPYAHRPGYREEWRP
ncbi:DUF6221 family protein [Micromonospora zhanjiangensis]|uniref:DUF6221 family protein n=1 Tax=Micromonospora zhanjiangensis TaxID=1522057 RepID=A0ABV8KP87_9ACTN